MRVYRAVSLVLVVFLGGIAVSETLQVHRSYAAGTGSVGYCGVARDEGASLHPVWRGPLRSTRARARRDLVVFLTRSGDPTRFAVRIWRVDLETCEVVAGEKG